MFVVEIKCIVHSCNPYLSLDNDVSISIYVHTSFWHYAFLYTVYNYSLNVNSFNDMRIYKHNSTAYYWRNNNWY